MAWTPPQAAAAPKRQIRIVSKNSREVARERALQEFCSLLLNLNEFVYVD
ncbi:MAG: hypothetical protein GWO24_34630 [Akkermansiaceae bacterium]|nr:hypothetical protein [Akkermansiaceae bacterium]